MTQPTYCIFCNRPLSPDNSAAEHVIPNALGGRLKTYDATCVTCNSAVRYLSSFTIPIANGKLALSGLVQPVLSPMPLGGYCRNFLPHRHQQLS